MPAQEKVFFPPKILCSDVQDSFHCKGEPKDLLCFNEKQKQTVVGWVPQAGHPGNCEKPSRCPGGLLWSPNGEPGSNPVALRKEYGYMNLILIHLPSQKRSLEI